MSGARASRVDRGRRGSSVSAPPYLAALPSATHPGIDDEALLRRTLDEASDLAYVDPTAAQRMLLSFRALVDGLEVSSADLEIGSRQLFGNVANQQLDFELSRAELAAALERARVAGLGAKQADVAADLLGPLLNLDRLPEAAELLEEGKRLAEAYAGGAAWRLLTREGFLYLRVADAASAYASFAEAQRRQPPIDTPGLRKRDAYYASMLQAGLAELYSGGGDHERGVLAHEAVVAICERYGLRGRLPYHYLALGRAQMQTDDVGGARANFRRTVDLATDRDRSARAAALANLGYYASREGDWRAASALFEEAEHHYRASGIDTHADLAMVYLWRAEMAERRGTRPIVATLLEAAFEEARQGSDPARQALVCGRLAEHHAGEGDFEQAYQYRLVHEDLSRAASEAGNRRRISDLELRHELEERRREHELLQLRTAELQLKALRAQMNPHFIFNALNAIQASITATRTGDAAAHLAQFARLMRRSLEYSERTAITLEEEIAFLDEYLALNRALRYAVAFTYEITVAEDLETDLIRLPAMLVQPYLENALEHGLRLREDGRVWLSFSSPPDDEDRLVIVIEDNGIGRAAAAAKRERSPTHKSMGTDITRHRLELLNRGNAAATEVAFEDLYDAAGAAAGTRVTVSLPVQWAQ